jgi:hypothetical protein
VLIPAGDLVNGTTIRRHEADGFDTLDYYHLKLAGHDVITAQGTPCESLLLDGHEADAPSRARLRLDRLSGPTPTTCAPRLSFNGGRNASRSRLRSALSP